MLISDTKSQGNVNSILKLFEPKYRPLREIYFMYAEVKCSMRT